MVVPDILEVSLTFSLILDFRVPRSGHGAVATSVFSEPEGSTKMCIRVFEREVTGVAGGGAAKTSWLAVAREDDVLRCDTLTICPYRVKLRQKGKDKKREKPKIT